MIDYEKIKQKKQQMFEKKKNRELSKRMSSWLYFFRLVRQSNRSGNHNGCFRYFPNNTDEHEDMKYQVYKALMKKGHEVIVEAIFETGDRANILDCSTGVIYEIIKSEKEKDCLIKSQKYPKECEVVIIDANKPFNINDLIF